MTVIYRGWLLLVNSSLLSFEYASFNKMARIMRHGISSALSNEHTLVKKKLFSYRSAADRGRRSTHDSTRLSHR